MFNGPKTKNGPNPRSRVNLHTTIEIAISIVWIARFFAWELLGLPYGPG
jgi:hypothetical protein